MWLYDLYQGEKTNDIIIDFKNVKKGENIKPSKQKKIRINKSMEYKTKAIEEINNKNF